jgi:hypothetical protein
MELSNTPLTSTGAIGNEFQSPEVQTVNRHSVLRTDLGFIFDCDHSLWHWTIEMDRNAMFAFMERS